MWRPVSILAAVLLLVSPSMAAESKDAASAQALVKKFYTTYFQHPFRELPDPKTMQHFRHFFSSEFGAMLVQAERTVDRIETQHSEAAPMVEGDQFTSDFEGANIFLGAQCALDGDKAQCRARLNYQEGKDRGKPWVDGVVLRWEGGGWKIDDIVYSGNFAFGNRGHLRLRLVNLIRTEEAWGIEDQVLDFYTGHLKQPFSGLPEDAGLDGLRVLLTDDLIAVLRSSRSGYEKVAMLAGRDFLLQGLDPPLEVNRPDCGFTDDETYCDVELHHQIKSSGSYASAHLILILKKTGQGWRVDDVHYGDKDDSPTLRALLKSVP